MQSLSLSDIRPPTCDAGSGDDDSVLSDMTDEDSWGVRKGYRRPAGWCVSGGRPPVHSVRGKFNMYHNTSSATSVSSRAKVDTSGYEVAKSTKKIPVYEKVSYDHVQSKVGIYSRYHKSPNRVDMKQSVIPHKRTMAASDMRSFSSADNFPLPKPVRTGSYDTSDIPNYEHMTHKQHSHFYDPTASSLARSAAGHRRYHELHDRCEPTLAKKDCHGRHDDFNLCDSGHVESRLMNLTTAAVEHTRGVYRPPVEHGMPSFLVRHLTASFTGEIACTTLPIEQHEAGADAAIDDVIEQRLRRLSGVKDEYPATHCSGGELDTARSRCESRNESRRGSRTDMQLSNDMTLFGEEVRALLEAESHSVPSHVGLQRYEDYRRMIAYHPTHKLTLAPTLRAIARGKHHSAHVQNFERVAYFPAHAALFSPTIERIGIKYVSDDCNDRTGKMISYVHVQSRLYEATTASRLGRYVAPEPEAEPPPPPKSQKYSHVPSRLMESTAAMKNAKWSGEHKPTRRVPRHPVVTSTTPPDFTSPGSLSVRASNRHKESPSMPRSNLQQEMLDDLASSTAVKTDSVDDAILAQTAGGGGASAAIIADKQPSGKWLQSQSSLESHSTGDRTGDYSSLSSNYIPVDLRSVQSRLYEATTASRLGRYVAPEPEAEPPPPPKSQKYSHVPSRLMESTAAMKNAKWSGEHKPTRRVPRHPVVTPPSLSTSSSFNSTPMCASVSSDSGAAHSETMVKSPGGSSAARRLKRRVNGNHKSRAIKAPDDAQLPPPDDSVGLPEARLVTNSEVLTRHSLLRGDTYYSSLSTTAGSVDNRDYMSPAGALVIDTDSVSVESESSSIETQKHNVAYVHVQSRLYEATTASRLGRYVAPEPEAEPPPPPKSQKYSHVPSRLMESTAAMKNAKWSGEHKPTRRVPRHPVVTPPSLSIGSSEKKTPRTSGAVHVPSIDPSLGTAKTRLDTPAYCDAVNLSQRTNDSHDESVIGERTGALESQASQEKSPAVTLLPLEALDRQLSAESVDSILWDYCNRVRTSSLVWSGDEDDDEDDGRILQLSPLIERRGAWSTDLRLHEVRERAESEGDWWIAKTEPRK